MHMQNILRKREETILSDHQVQFAVSNVCMSKMFLLLFHSLSNHYYAS